MLRIKCAALYSIWLAAMPFASSVCAFQQLLEAPLPHQRPAALFEELQQMSGQELANPNPAATHFFGLYPYTTETAYLPTNMQENALLFSSNNYCIPCQILTPPFYTDNQPISSTRKRGYSTLSYSDEEVVRQASEAHLLTQPALVLEQPEHLQWFESLVSKGYCYAVKHMRRAMRNSINEQFYPGSCRSLLEILHDAACKQTSRIKYFNTVATILKLIALGQNAHLSAPYSLQPFEKAYQLQGYALNTSSEASEEFFKDSELTAKELQQGITLCMFHPSMIELIGNKEYERTTFNDCIKKIKEYVTTYEQRRDILKHHYTEPLSATCKLPDHDKNRQTVILMFLDWTSKDKSLAAFCPNELTLHTQRLPLIEQPHTTAFASHATRITQNQTNATHQHIRHPNRSYSEPLNNSPKLTQSDDTQRVKHIVDSIAQCASHHTPHELHSLIVRYLQKESNESTSYVWSVLFPLEEYEKPSSPEVHSPPLLTPLPEYELATDNLLSCAQETSAQLNSDMSADGNVVIQTDGDDDSASIMVRIAGNDYDCQGTQRLLYNISHISTLRALIDLLRCDPQATETHITMAKLYAIKKGAHLAASSITNAQNAAIIASLGGIQRQTHSLNISQDAAHQFFSDEYMSTALIKIAMQAGMFHEQMIYLFLIRAPCPASFNRFLNAIAEIITKEQFKAVCDYQKNNTINLMSYYKSKAVEKKWSLEDIQKKLEKIATRMNTFYSKSHANLSESPYPKKRAPYKVLKEFRPDKWSSFIVLPEER